MQETCNGDTSGLSEAPAANSPGGAEQPERRLALVCQLLASDAGERLSEIFQPVRGYLTHSSLRGKGKERRKAIKDKEHHDHTHQPEQQIFPPVAGAGAELTKGLQNHWCQPENEMGTQGGARVSWVMGRRKRHQPRVPHLVLDR